MVGELNNLSPTIRVGIWVLVGLVLIVAFCALNLHCSGDPAPHATAMRVRNELQAGLRERRIQEADNLAVMARDLRVMAQRYLRQGEKTKAQRAIGAAQELDKRIEKLRSQATCTSP